MTFIKIEDKTNLSNDVIFGIVYSKIADQLKLKKLLH